MVNLFRRFQQPLLIGLTIFTIISFVVLYNLPGTRNGTYRTDSVGTIYNHNVSQSEYQRAGHRFEVCRSLQLFDLLGGLAGDAHSMNEAVDNFIWNSMVLRHEAEALGIMSAVPEKSEREALAEQVQDRIVKMPLFQNNGAFDINRYNLFVQNVLGPNGFGPGEIEDIVIDDIRLQKVKEVVGGTVAATPDELRSAYTERNQKMEVSVVRLKLDDFKTAAQISDDEIKKLFESRKDSLKTPEKRKVKYVEFTLPKTDKPLMGQERGVELEKMMNSAQDLAQKMTEKGAKLAALAGEAKVEVKETPLFEESKPPKELSGSQPAAEAAFRLTQEDPNSDVVRGNNTYYVLQLSGVEAARPLTFDEAKPQLVEQLKDEKGQEAMGLKATEIRNKIDAAVKAGQSFDDAAQAAGAKAEKVPAFSMMERIKTDPDAQTIMGRAMELSEGQVSDFTPTATGGLILHLDKRLPVDEAAFEKEKPTLAEGIARQKREAVFRDWLEARSKAANHQFRMAL